jgi:imidazole glycerol-phosphate synthase subunit HisF
MLAKRIIPCLDVKEGKVVKGVRFNDHELVGDIITLAQYYSDMGADELVFYDITASPENRVVDYTWVSQVAKVIQIPFCVAGGIRTLAQAEKILLSGADKISINSPAIENPHFIKELAENFGTQCVVVGIDSKRIENHYLVYQYTGSVKKSSNTQKLTQHWLQAVQALGAGEIVLNCMDHDGVRQGYDLEQLCYLQTFVDCPIVASGGAGCMQDFEKLFNLTHATGALAASVFHKGLVTIPSLKQYLIDKNIKVRIC